ncbi:MAG: tetratricopeptide repeat protein [Bacteroidales bacterium]
MNHVRILIISIFLTTITLSVFPQRTATYTPPEQLYNSALELFHKQKYGAAQKQFIQVSEQITAPSSIMRASAEYYAALCALELFNEDAEEMLSSFIEAHPEHSKVRMAHFQMGRLYYRKKRYRQAIRSFEKVDEYDLTGNQSDEYNFKAGYAYFMTNHYEEAKNHLYKIINQDNRYHDPANYYYAHIAYENEKYETALSSFNKLMENEIFQPVLPYYISQIYYKQEKYDKLLEVAPNLLDKATEKRKPEIARLIGDAYYNKRDYRKALPFLQQYHESARRSTTRDDHYQMAYTYYRTGNYNKAIKEFDKVTTKNDKKAQNAYYHMADCYLKTGQKKFAYNAFLSAYKSDVVAEVSKDALFNYAKIAYEMSYDPYNEAINAFQKFIREFPESDRIDEANSYLVKLFLSTKNFRRALQALEKIDDKSTDLEIAYQQIAYSLGVKLFNNREIEKSIELFQKSMQYNYSKELYAKSLYWTAEARYRQGNYEQAIENYKEFQVTSGSFRLPYYNESNYHIGYAHFKTDQINKALTAFRKYLHNAESENEKRINDATLRTADCYYTLKRYDEAIEKYDEAISLESRDTDYAAYQKAIAQGVTGDFQGKTTTLKTLITSFPTSTYADDATYELANTYLIMDDNQQALQYFNHLIENYPHSDKLVRSMQKKALVYYNTDNYDLALNTFKNIRDKYPGTKESKEALVSIRNIYTNINKPEEFFNYARENAIQLSTDEQDSTMFYAAEKIYMDNDCEKAIPSLQKYLDKYSSGIFALNAHYYLADCLYRQGNKQEAKPHYQIIADTSMTNYKEEAVLKLAGIKYNNKEFKDAITYYQKLEKISSSKKNILEARKWSMRAYMKIEDYQQAIQAARKLKESEKVSSQWINEAYMTIGKSALELDSISTAKKAFDYLTDNLNNEMSVEAKYLTAEIQYQEGDLEESESLLFEIINQVPSYDYWIAKSFILIADIYRERDNIIQAKATLQSIIENYQVDPSSSKPNLVDIAEQKLTEITEKEEEEEKPSEQEDIELDYQGKEESSKLFEQQNETEEPIEE